MKIVSKDYCPDSTYFSMSNVAPYLSDNTLIICNGEGSRRSSWGAPATTSTVVFKGRTLIAIHVGFHHKHRGGQGWHYFRKSGETWEKATWGKLVDSDRKKVLDRKAKAPAWAKSPGKLRKERKPQPKRKLAGGKLAYKIMAKYREQLHSLYDPSTTYELGQAVSEPVQEDHGGGYYVYFNKSKILRAWRNQDLVDSESLWNWAEKGADFVLVEVAADGTQLKYYGPDKTAVEKVTPVRVIEVLDDFYNYR